MVGIVALAQQERANQHSKDSSDFEGMIILPAQLSELTGSSQANSTGSSVANSSPGSTQQDKQATRIQSTTGKSKQYDEMTICYAGCDAGCKMQDMTGNA